MKIRRAAVMFVASIIAASCSEKSAPDREKETTDARREQVREESGEGDEERQPEEDQIAEDCVAFVRSTKVVSGPAANADCPGCPPAGTDAVTFRHIKIDAVSCAGDACNVAVTISVEFNPGSGERIAGGLTAWIPPEQRSAYLSGQAPAGEQVYRVQITYKRRGEGWRAVEFDRAPGGN